MANRTEPRAQLYRGTHRPARNWRRIALSFALPVAMILLYFWVQKRQAERFNAFQSSMRKNSGNGIGTGMGMMRLGEGQRAEIAEMTPKREPRFFASLAQTAGDYTISVRQIVGTTFDQNLYSNKYVRSRGVPLEQLLLAIQVLSPSVSAQRRIKTFMTPLTAVDDTGKRLEAEEIRDPVLFDGGMAQAVRLPAPDEKARLLASLEGTLILQEGENGKEQRLTFRLQNIPLPVEQHIFGTVGLGYLSAEEERRIPVVPDGGFPMVRGEAAEALRHRFPPHTPEPSPLKVPWRLLLTQGIENAFLTPLPGKIRGGTLSALPCFLKPELDSDGEIRAELRVQLKNGSSVRSTFRFWDSEANVILLPSAASEIPGRRVAMRLYLFLSYRNSGPATGDEYIPMAPFTAKGRERGSVISGAVCVGDEALKWGGVAIDVTPIDATGHSTESRRRILVRLDAKGRWRVGNLAPGLYRFRLGKISPYRPDILPTRPLPEYFARRYGNMRFDVENLEQDKIEVRPGSIIALRPWRLTPTQGEGFPFEGKGAEAGAHSAGPNQMNSMRMSVGGQGR
jgi:hypothetical protein